MKIHFCDLCNESVPQSDLDDGRAFLRKGRITCAHCESVMSHAADTVRARARALRPNPGDLGRAEWAIAAEREAANQAGVTSSATSNAPANGIAVTAPAIESVPRDVAGPLPHGSSAAPAHAVVIQRGGSAGTWLALCSIAGLAITAGLFHDRLSRDERVTAGLRADLATREGEIQMMRREVSRAETAVADAERRATARVDALADRTETQRRELELARTERDAAVARLATLETTLRQISEARASETLELERRLAELSRGVAKSEDDRRAFDERLTAVELTPRPAAAPTPVPEPLAKPAWFALLDGLKSDNNSLRWEAVNQIGEAKDPASVPHLVPLLKDVDVIVRMAAARVLGEIGSKEAVPALIDALEDSESAMREYTYVALRQVTGADLKFEYDANEAERARRVKAWREWWKKESEAARS